MAADGHRWPTISHASNWMPGSGTQTSRIGSMILELLHNMERKHVQDVRKFQLLKSFHAKAGMNAAFSTDQAYSAF